MKFTTSNEIDQIIHMIELGLEEHSKWIKLWNSKAICQLPLPDSYLDKKAYQDCDFAKWFDRCSKENWLHQVDFESISSVHKSMHEEARKLSDQIHKGETISEEDYYKFVNFEWSFSHQLQKLKDKIARLQISFDPLTGIFNRQALMPILMQEKAYIERDGKQCCLAMADLDFFKNVNDTHGHANGDVVLQKVAGFLRNNLRPYDALFRYGGEEFLFCLPNADTDSGKRLLDRLRMDIEKMPIKVANDTVISITLSMGITQMLPKISIEDSIVQADEALYEAKNKGRNRIMVYH
ncbi:diguanylate cyclase [bacterium]|nr:diguanylate cyclase [bacterium]